MADFDVPPDNPFENDLLERGPAIESLTRIVESADSPYVISVDAEWGAGKTAFLKMWSQHLRNQGFHVLHFNAWETDFANSPFQALSGELTRSLEQYSDSTIQDITRTLRRSASEIALTLARAGVRGAGTFLPIVGPVAAEAAVNAIDSMSGDPISEYQRARRSIEELRRSIGKVSTALSSGTQGKPLVVAIDELDRCRPSYAIELIETAKHIFLVDNVVFILAINSSALAHSIRALYGAAFDAEAYMRRFIDLQFRLPEHDRTRFVRALLRSARLRDLTDVETDEAALSLMLFESFLSDAKYSLRDTEQATHRLGLVLQLLDRVEPWMVFSAVVGLILRAAEPETYLRFLRNETTDEEILDTLFANLPMETSNLAEAKAKIEGAVVAIAQPRLPGDTGMFAELRSPLIQRHRRTHAEIDPSQKGFTDEQAYAVDVTSHASDVWSSLQLHDSRPQLMEAMQFLELLLPGYSSDL
ncbi:MAG: P-loop NTPase fold protein [Chloroflexota bacterium]|nr:P-loop NTPase fold protein [Chloroflexota bacterium]MDE2886536.1 P-loop NTPase fold protein [Chloroflexota bacterium]